MKEFLNKNFVSLIVIGLLIILYFQRCSSPVPTVPKATHDTVYTIIHHYHDSTIYSKPTLINHIAPKPIDIPPQMEADTSYPKLLSQYDSLKKLYYSRNIYRDSINVDSIGSVSITDTTFQNQIVGRKWHTNFDIKEHVITITNTIPIKPRTQVYIGGSVYGSENQLVNGAGISLLLRNKRDQMYGITAQKLLNYPITYGANFYYKLKLRKLP